MKKSSKQQVASSKVGRVVTVGRVRSQLTAHRIPSVAAWDAFAREFAKNLKPGDVVAVSGELGAGKTTFVQALAKALGVKKRPPSPTFALMRSYDLPKPVNGITRLIHVDAYRFDNERDLAVLDLDAELADGASVLVIEWPERTPEWLRRRSAIRISISE